MKHYIKLLLLLSLSTLILQAEAILQLDTKGHTGLIKDIIVTSDGSEIVSASQDKTIRVWDARTGKEKRKILGEIGIGTRGGISAIALSKNDKYLAIGGQLINSPLRIYNFQTGQLLKVLRSHKKPVIDLSFSKDSRYLISGSGDKTAKIWDVDNNFALTDTIDFHKTAVYATKIIKKADHYFAVTAGFDKKITLYDMQKSEVVKSAVSKYKIGFMATTNANGGNIAVSGFGNEILIYDYNLNLIKKIKSETNPIGLAYSKNGKLLIAGTGKNPINVNIYQTTRKYKKLSSFKKHTGATLAVSFLDDRTAVSCGGESKEIYIWDIKTMRTKKKIVGIGRSVRSVGISKGTVAFSNRSKGKLKKEINLKTLRINQIRNSNAFKKINIKNENYSLERASSGTSWENET